MTLLPLILRRETWPLTVPFVIAHGTKTAIETVSLSLWDGSYTGVGECRPYARYDETVESVLGQLGALSKQLRADITHDDIQTLLPAGAARNALDLALWDLRARQAQKPLHELLNIDVKPVRTTDTTISIDSSANMAKAASDALAQFGANVQLKIKLGGPEKNAALEAERLKTVRATLPQAQLIVDANEGWNVAMLQQLVPTLNECNLLLLEQPLPAGDDDVLRDIKLNCPIYADESVHDRASLTTLDGKYQGINIKLDKTGGLTEALALKDAAIAAGYKIMVGCMVAPSRTVAPALLVAQGADIVADLDGPALLSKDSSPSLRYANGMVSL